MAAPTSVPPAPGLPRGPAYLPELEALRGFAIVLVFLFHAGSLLDHTNGAGRMVSPLAGFVYSGSTGVDLFFILSGFLLSRPFLRAAATGAHVHLGRYFARRALRILPLYWVAVVVATVVHAGRWSDLRDGLPYAVFLNSFAHVATPLWPFSIPWWSLATEVQFYLVLPLLALFLRRRVGRIGGIVVVLIWAWAYRRYCLGRWLPPIFPTDLEARWIFAGSLFMRGPLFLLGIAAAAVHDRWGATLRSALQRSRWIRHGVADVALAGILIAMGFVLRDAASVGWPQNEGDLHVLWHAEAGVGWAAIVMLLLVAPLRTRPLWVNRVMIRIGVLSYSLYLVHLPILHRVMIPIYGFEPDHGWTATSAALVAGLLAGCLALSAVTYRLIEQPFLREKAALGRRVVR